MPVDQLPTVREVTTTSRKSGSALGVVSKLGVSFREVLTAAVTMDDGVAASIEIPVVVPLSQPCGIDPEVKYVPEVAVMTCAPVTGYFELIDRKQVRITSAKFLQRERLLNEMKIAKPQARREADEHQIPTVAHSDTNDGMIQELSKEREELDQPNELSEADEAVIDALLQELEFEIAFPVRDERIELIAEMEGQESLAKCCGAPDVLAEVISVDHGTSSSETMNEAEGKCGSKSYYLTGRFERPNSLIPIEVIHQHPTLCHGSHGRSWVPTESMVDDDMSVSRWACVGSAGRPTESMADGNPAKL